MTFTNATDDEIAELTRSLTSQGYGVALLADAGKVSIEYVEYRDPLAPEPANPHRWVDGYRVVDSRKRTA